MIKKFPHVIGLGVGLSYGLYIVPPSDPPDILTRKEIKNNNMRNVIIACLILIWIFLFDFTF
jgi:hypothetical protein